VVFKPAWIIAVKDVPSDMAIHQYIYSKTDLKDQIKKVQSRTHNYLSVPLLLGIEELRSSVLEGIKKFGQYQFQYGAEASKGDGIYLSTSLSFNPDAYDKISGDPHQATLGSTALKFNSASKYEKESGIAFKNSYHDTLAFREKTPIACFGAIGSFLNSFERTIIRSRISTVVSNKEETTKFGFNWHNDESIFINLRINIPVQTSPNYVVQILKEEQGNELQFDEFSMEAGKAYVYNTEKYHRAFCKKVENFDRVHMICGISPWFDFDEKTQSWISNEYYGLVHPFDMLAQGLASPLIKK
jgi:hypothetical protein